MDLILGDPLFLPHPVMAMGAMIKALEKRLFQNNVFNGAVLAIIMLLSVFFGSGIVLTVSYIIHPALFVLVESIMTWQCIAMRSMAKASCEVKKALEKKDIGAARKAVSMIVGRDTDGLDESGIIRAAVESVAESTTDGVISPMFYLLFFGPVFGMVFKASSTMDSMIGYKNERYMYFGRAAARIDDVLNFIPARIAAILMIIAAALCPDTGGKNAVRIFMRDRNKHPSPNSGQTESVCAGALGLKLSGDAAYGGVLVKKETIGDSQKRPDAGDIIRINRLMYITGLIFTFLGIGVLWFITAVISIITK